MQIIPVIDLKGGQAVHALRGERERYAPVQGLFASGGDAVALATSYRDQLGCRTCYVADLDAIAGAPGHTAVLRELATLGLALWVDAGVSSAAAAWQLSSIGVAKIIVGSESLGSVDQIAALAGAYPAANLALSVDLRGGVLRAPAGIDTPSALVVRAAAAGIREFILLDLARVGAEAGPPLDLLGSLRPGFPHLAFYAGGGVRGRADLEALRQAGAAGALIATAFHRGALTADDVRDYDSGVAF